MTTISLALIVKNEEKHIARCLESARALVDEIVVVDTGSTDRTREIALSLGAKVSEFRWVDDFAAARNEAIERTSGDWVLMLDADERLAADYSKELRAFVAGGERIGRINMKSRFLQNGAEQTVQSAISRIFPRHVRFHGAIHEQLVSDLPRADSGLTALHEGYYETDKSERNLRLLEKELRKQPNDPYLLFHIGKQYRGTGDYAKAAKYFERGYEQLVRNNGADAGAGAGTAGAYAADAVVDYLYVLLETKDFSRALDVIGWEQAELQLLADFHFVCGLIYTDLAIQLPQEAGELLPLIENSYLTALALGESGQAREIVQGTSSYLAAYNLGVFYEMMGNRRNAKECYEKAAAVRYAPALARLSGL